MPIDNAHVVSEATAVEGTRVDAATAFPELADVGRRLLVWWAEEAEWFSGVLAAIEAGHDDGGDAGDFRVTYDDGDEQWEPLGSRTRFKWAGERVLGAPPILGAISPPGRSGTSPSRFKRMLSEKSALAPLPDAKHLEHDPHAERDIGNSVDLH